MANKLKQFLQWVKLVRQADYQNSRIHFFNKRCYRLFHQITDTNYGFKSCIVCEHNTHQPCNNDCPSHLVNNLYFQNWNSIINATKKYDELVARRKAAWQELTRFRKK